MSETQALLDDVAKLQAAQDAAGLKALEDHGDKKVRKAARRAIHALRSKGVEIPDQARTWAEANVQSMRGHAGPAAMLDMAASPALTRVNLSLPNEEEGASLLLAIIDPTDRILNFGAYHQTDGQQARTVRDWEREAEGRIIPASWVQGRLFWARNETHRRNFELPKGFDEQLPKLGEAPSERPQPIFLDQALAEIEPATTDLGEILISAGVHTWPLLFDANELFVRLGQATKDVDADTLTEVDRHAHIMTASKGNEPLRTGLRGPLANALDDAAVILWLDGALSEAGRVRQLAVDLRESAEPEQVDGVVNLIQFQISVAAMEQMRQQAAENQDQDHDHVHDENCDHDHD